MEQKVIIVECPACSEQNEVPIHLFYDGYEGPIFCKVCSEMLEIDAEE
ncbi:MAG: hypothetical protein ACP5E4_01060 [Candidatus Aenigmatarchaeota archaeon]